MINFKLDIDADGIALVTWDMPGRSMNVIDASVTEELAGIVEKVATDAAIKGAVVTSGKEAFCAGADLTMLEQMAAKYAALLKSKGEEAANQMVFDESRKLSQLYRRLETSRQAVGRRHQRHRHGRRLRAVPRLPSPRRLRQSEDAARPAGSEGRPVPRRRRHPARRAHDAAGRRAAIPAQGRPAARRPRQGDEAHRQRRAGSRSHQSRQGLDQGRRQGASRPGTCKASGCPAARSIPRPA